MGVDFTHQAATFDARLDHIMPQVAAMGASVTVADFDRDGWQDFYVTNSSEDSLNRLYRNNGNNTFTDVAAEGRSRRRERARDGRVDGRRCGATSTTTAGKTCSSTGTGVPELFRNVDGRSFRRSVNAQDCRRG